MSLDFFLLNLPAERHAWSSRFTRPQRPIFSNNIWTRPASRQLGSAQSPTFPNRKTKKVWKGSFEGWNEDWKGENDVRMTMVGSVERSSLFVAPPPTSIASVKNDDILVEALLRLEDPQTLPRVLTKIQSGVRKVT